MSGITDSSLNPVVQYVTYDAASRLLGMSFNNVTETRGYNVLGQLTNLYNSGGVNLTYNYPTGANNGKVSSMYNAVSGETVTYAYDSLNRMATASGSGWAETYTLDPYGNLTTKQVTSGSGPSLSVSVNQSTNQIQGYGFGYDANGNSLLSSNGTPLAYDAENRVSAVGWSNNPPLVDYSYDAQNKRIFMWTAGTLDSFSNVYNYSVVFYSPSGQKLGTYLLAPAQPVFQPNGINTPYVTASLVSSDQYFGGRRLAPMDQLGSAGTYYPWGEAKGTTNPQDTWSYATYWRDSTTGLDYANNRYYSNVYGRFMTPDPSRSSGGPGNPQSWNRYAYTSGDPVNFRDPAGLMETAVCDFDGNEAEDCLGGGEDPSGYCGPSIEDCSNTCVGADGFIQNPGPNCQADGGPPTSVPSSAPPPPCQDDWGNVDQTLEGLAANIITLAEKQIKGLTPMDISAVEGTIQSDITSEMNTIMEAGTGNTNPPYYQGGHYNLDLTNQSIIGDLGPLGNQFIKDFTSGLFGTLDGVRQSAPDQPGYTLHSKLYYGSQIDFHFDQFGYGNLPGHWGYDVIYGSLAHPCLDPAWQH